MPAAPRTVANDRRMGLNPTQRLKELPSEAWELSVKFELRGGAEAQGDRALGGLH